MSDGASDISDVNTCTSSNSNASASNFVESLTEEELLQIDMFYRSHKTEVFVCQCLANLYYGSAKNSGKSGEWIFSLTGVPVLVLDTGDHRRQRKLNLVLAERGTGFVLFKDDVDNLTDYSMPHSNFHTLHLSTDHTKLAGLSFDDSASANDFYSTLRDLTTKPDDDLMNLSKKSRKAKKKDKQHKKYKAPSKTEISQPCCFVHVTNVDRQNLQTPDDVAILMNSKLQLKHSESSDFSEETKSLSSQI